MIFSLLKIRKKTSAVLAGILIGITCLWGIALWQDIPASQLLMLLLGSFAFIAGIMLLALLIITVFKLVMKLLRGVGNSTENGK